MELLLDHTRRTFQKISRYVNNGALSEESVDYVMLQMRGSSKHPLNFMTFVEP